MIPPGTTSFRPDARAIRVVNALPPLKVVQLLGNACLSPTTLAPKDPFRSCGPRWILWFSLFSEEPHWLIPNEPVGELGAMPAAWLATVARRCHSVDVFQQGRFLFSRQPPNTPWNRSVPSWYQLCSRQTGQLRLIRDHGLLMLGVHLKSVITYPKIPVYST